MTHQNDHPGIRGGKSLMERAIEDMKKMGVDIQTEPKKEAPKPIPRSETEEELILAVRSAETSISTMEHRLSAFRERSDADTTAILDAVSSVSAEVAEINSTGAYPLGSDRSLGRVPSCLPIASVRSRRSVLDVNIPDILKISAIPLDLVRVS